MLKAGFARVDVTPPLGTFIPGAFKARYSRGVLDPIELNAIAYSDGEATALLIASDFLAVDRVAASALRAEISADTGVPSEHIMITALHQHTSFSFYDISAKRTCKREIAPALEAYEAFLHFRYRDVARMALDDMSEATALYAERETAEQIAFVRRYYMKDGTVATNPGGRAHQIDRPCDSPDNTVRLVRFQREGKRDIALVNFCTHPDVIGGEYYSADWPGFARRYVEADIEGVSCLVLTGAQGDSNHYDFMHEMKRGYGHSDHMGRVIADTVRDIYPTAAAMDGVRVTGGERTVILKTRIEGIEDYEACVKMHRDYCAGTLGYSPTAAELGHMARITKLLEESAFRRIPVMVLRLGQLAIVGYGGEPFLRYAAAVREACPDDVILSACCANGYEGYLPTAKALGEGGYEAASCPFPETVEEECVGAAIELVKTL